MKRITNVKGRKLSYSTETVTERGKNPYKFIILCERENTYGKWEEFRLAITLDEMRRIVAEVEADEVNP